MMKLFTFPIHDRGFGRGFRNPLNFWTHYQSQKLDKNHSLFSALSQEYREYTRGRGKFSCTV